MNASVLAEKIDRTNRLLVIIGGILTIQLMGGVPAKEQIDRLTNALESIGKENLSE